MNVAGEDRCMRLVYKDGDNSYYPPPDDVINKIQDNYGINVFDYCMHTSPLPPLSVFVF